MHEQHFNVSFVNAQLVFVMMTMIAHQSRSTPDAIIHIRTAAFHDVFYANRVCSSSSLVVFLSFLPVRQITPTRELSTYEEEQPQHTIFVEFVNLEKTV